MTKNLLLFFVLLFATNFSFAQIENYGKWYICDEHVNNGYFKIFEGESKEIEFTVEVWRFKGPNDEYEDVNFQFHLARWPVNESDWCESIVLSSFSVTTDDFETNSNFAEKSFNLEVTEGTAPKNLHDEDKILLFILDPDEGECNDWASVEKNYTVQVYPSVPTIPTNFSATRTGNGTSVRLAWQNNGNNINQANVRYRASGGNWSNEVAASDLTAHTFNGMTLNSIEFQVRSKNSSGWSPWASTSIGALSLTAPTDVEFFRPYYYNLRWTSAIDPLLTGNIEVQSSPMHYTYFGTIATINDIHATNSNHISTSLPTSRYRLKFTDQHGRVKYSNEVHINHEAPQDVELIKPYHFSLSWSDVIDPLITGTIEVLTSNQDGTYFGTIATINDIHATSYYIGSSLTPYAYRLKFTDQLGRVTYSNIVDVSLKAPQDVDIFKPYYYNLRWSDVNHPLITGKIEVLTSNQDGTYFGTIATINDIHATSYYIGSSLTPYAYRLKFTDQFGRVAYSNIVNTSFKPKLKGEKIDASETDEISDYKITIFPNPVSDNLSVSFIGGEKIEYKIINNLGIIIKEGFVSNGSTIGLNELSPAVYYFIATDKTPIKLIKQ